MVVLLITHAQTGISVASIGVIAAVVTLLVAASNAGGHQESGLAHIAFLYRGIRLSERSGTSGVINGNSELD